jgi:glycerate 2-kinase
VSDRAAPGRPRVLVAPDSFKGTIGPGAVAAALAAGLERPGLDVDRCPLADGGDGSLAVILAALGGEVVEVGAHDALGRPVEAAIGLAAGGEVAIVETAAAIGLARIAPADRDPEAATSAGAGELIAAAARRAPTVLVGLGGSATNDGGAGALDVIGAAGGLGPAQLVCLCDVRTPWERASAAYGPQKGAGAATVGRLAARLEALAPELPRNPRGVPMTGAAGGLAGGLWAGAGARLVAGASFICDLVGFDRRAARADRVITGEGRLDASSAEGKVVGEVAARCRRLGLAVDAVVGADASDAATRAWLGLASVTEAGDAGAIAEAAAGLARRWRG